MGNVPTALKSHPWRSIAGVAVILVAGAAFFARDMIGIALTADEPIDLTLPIVEPLEPGPGEVVYRIDAANSSATVTVEEVLAGVDNTVELQTKGLAGDLGVTNGDASTARLSEVQVSVHQLESDNNLRDKVLQHEFLESHDHRTVSLHDAEIVDVEQADGTQEATFAIEGDLEVKTEHLPVRFEATAAIDGDTLTATASTTVKMSDLGIGPIDKVGLVSTGDDVKIDLDLVAVDGRNFTPPTGLALASVDVGAGGEGTAAPSYSEEIQPVLEQNCASCHNTGAVGAQMLTLDTAGDAAEVADGLALVTDTGYMPPWPPSDVGVPVHDPRGLDPDEIDAIGRWAAAGAPLDVKASTKIEAPEEPEVARPDRDVVMEMDEPYEGDGSDPDDYRCFLMDPGFTEPEQVTGFEFTPGSLEVVHHVLTYRVKAAEVAEMQRKDADDPDPGYSCGTGMGTGGGGLVGGWVPGQRPRDFGEGVGLPFEPGDQLVTQIHYHYEGIIRPDQSTVAMELADDPSSITSLNPVQLVAPVEIPCPAPADGEFCDRSAALDDAVERGAASRFVADGLHRLCGTTPEELAAKSDGWTANTTCTYPIRSEAQIVDFLGHMHEIGSTYRMTLNKDTPEELVLLDIPVWNFSWQLNYQPVDPIDVKPGDKITVECNWDRSLRYDADPRYIFFAEGTLDEMCFSTVTFLPKKP